MTIHLMAYENKPISYSVQLDIWTQHPRQIIVIVEKHYSIILNGNMRTHNEFKKNNLGSESEQTQPLRSLS